MISHHVMRFAVIPTHNRPNELRSLVTSLSAQTDIIIIIDNASNPPVGAKDLVSETSSPYPIIIRDGEQPPNLSRLWNVGLVAAESIARYDNQPRWDVAIFNDDAHVPDGWYDQVAHALRWHQVEHDPAVACTLPVPHAIFKTRPDNDLLTRMCPWAFVTRGELGLRADESMRWWWSDTDWDWQARLNGGVMIVPGPPVPNTLANSSTTGVLAEQAGHDRQTFAEKWGYNPW